MARRLWWLVALAGASAACIQFSPFQTEVDPDLRDGNKKSLEALSSRSRPPASADRPLVFAYLADTHDGYSQAKKIVAAINARPEIEVVLHGGDITDFGTAREFEWFLEAMADLKPPMVVVAGNHDGLSRGYSLYEQAFGPHDFSFVYAGLKFVFFNSNTLEYGRDRPNLEWFSGEVQNAEGAAKVVVVTHQPPDSKPDLKPEDQALYQQVQRDAGVFLNLYGHAHENWKVDKDGPVTYYKAQTAMHGTWSVITTDGQRLWYEQCVYETCSPKQEGP